MADFHDRAEERLRKVFAKHVIDASSRSSMSGKDRFLTFIVPTGEYEIDISDDITMVREHDGRLFECFLRREYASEEALIESFAGRLDRYLSGGPWQEPHENEAGPFSRFLRKLFARTKPST